MELNPFPKLSRWELCFRMRSPWLLKQQSSKAICVIELIASPFFQKPILEASPKSASGLLSRTWAPCATVAKFLGTKPSHTSLRSNPQPYQFQNQSDHRLQQNLKTIITLKLLFECAHHFQEKWLRDFLAPLPTSMVSKTWLLLSIWERVWTTRRASTTCRRTHS